MNKTDILRTMGFATLDDKVFGYKIFDAIYKSPEEWVIEPDSIIRSDVDKDETLICSYGIYFTTLAHLKEFYLNNVFAMEYNSPYFANGTQYLGTAHIGKSNLYPLTIWHVSSYIKNVIIPDHLSQYPGNESIRKIRTSKLRLHRATTFQNELSFLQYVAE